MRWQAEKHTRATGKQIRTDTFYPVFSLGSLLFISQEFLNDLSQEGWTDGNLRPFTVTKSFGI